MTMVILTKIIDGPCTQVLPKKKTKLGWQIELDDDKVFLNNFGNTVIYWELSVLKNFTKKIKSNDFSLQILKKII